MRNNLSLATILALLAAGLLVLTAVPTQAGPRQIVPGYAPGIVVGPGYAPPPPPPPRIHHQQLYRYYYYPNRQVYFDVDRAMWFWLSGGAWAFGAVLPPAFYGDLGTHVYFSMASARPFVHHYDHYRAYPPVKVKRWRPPHDRHPGWRHRPPPGW